MKTTYKENLNKLVLVSSTEDTTLVPKESSQFHDFDPELKRYPLSLYGIIQERLHWIKTLYEKNSVDFLSIEAEHMHIDEDFIKILLKYYLGEIMLVLLYFEVAKYH